MVLTSSYSTTLRYHSATEKLQTFTLIFQLSGWALWHLRALHFWAWDPGLGTSDAARACRDGDSNYTELREKYYKSSFFVPPVDFCFRTFAVCLAGGTLHALPLVMAVL